MNYLSSAKVDETSIIASCTYEKFPIPTVSNHRKLIQFMIAVEHENTSDSIVFIPSLNYVNFSAAAIKKNMPTSN